MVRIDIWSDVACPWCYVGKRNLEAALVEIDLEAEIHWRAFELDPSSPATVVGTLDEVLAAKYGMGLEQARAMNAQMTETARAAGLEYHLDRVQLGSSFDAHRLAKLAEARGRGAAAAERLFAAHFTEGRRISDPDTLLEIGLEIGLDEAEVRQVLESTVFTDQVRRDEADAQEAGITGVPTFVIDGRFAIPGAQSVETMARLLRRVTEDV